MWPCWRKYIPGAGIASQKPLLLQFAFSAPCLPLKEGSLSFLYLPPCLPDAMPPHQDRLSALLEAKYLAFYNVPWLLCFNTATEKSLVLCPTMGSLKHSLSQASEDFHLFDSECWESKPGLQHASRCSELSPNSGPGQLLPPPPPFLADPEDREPRASRTPEKHFTTDYTTSRLFTFYFETKSH